MRLELRALAASLCLVFATPAIAQQEVQVIEGVKCVVDDQLAAMNRHVDNLSRSSAESFIAKGPLPSEKACLPTLKKIAGAISGQLPSMSGAGIQAILKKLGEAACKAMDSAIRDASGRLKVGWEAPYGLGEVSVGVNNNGRSGVEISEKEPAIIRAAEGLVGDTVKKNTKDVVGGMKPSDSLGINRDAANKSREEWREIRDNVLKK